MYLKLLQLVKIQLAIFSRRLAAKNCQLDFDSLYFITQVLKIQL